MIPVGSIAAMNLLSGYGVLGRYAFEVTEDEIRAASVVALDVHWFPPLAILDGLLAELRRIRPDVPVVVGGITAAFYGRAFGERFDVDHVVSGDVERVLPELIGCLVDGRPAPPLVGVWSRDGAAPPGRAERLSPQRFDQLDCLTIDWFPTLQRRVTERHALHRQGRQVPSDPGFPTLVVTRGCARRCGFCHASYHDRVFGPGTLCRTPAGLVRDLSRLSRDPEIAFVTVFFGDGRVLDELAAATEAETFDLDGFLFFCGVASPDALHAWRAAFRGEVTFSVIQPADLAAVPGVTPMPPDALQGVLEGAPADARVAVYHVLDPEGSAVRAARTSERVELASARDWTLVRPNASLAPDDASRARQLDEVIAASGCLAAYHLLLALVPALRRHGLPAAIELPSLERRLLRVSDRFVWRLLQSLIQQVVDRGKYGCDELRIGWSVRDADAVSCVSWAPPAAPGQGSARWRAVLRGFCWDGEVDVPPDRRCSIAPFPRVFVRGQSFDLSTWAPARLPAITIEPGPARIVRLGGEQRADDLGLWVLDGDTRTEHRLRPTAG